MEAATKYREVVIPDAIASGRAGTGCDYPGEAGTFEACTSGTGRHRRTRPALHSRRGGIV
jgi:hypothetical protein